MKNEDLRLILICLVRKYWLDWTSQKHRAKILLISNITRVEKAELRLINNKVWRNFSSLFSVLVFYNKVPELSVSLLVQVECRVFLGASVPGKIKPNSDLKPLCLSIKSPRDLWWCETRHICVGVWFFWSLSWNLILPLPHWELLFWLHTHRCDDWKRDQASFSWSTLILAWMLHGPRE